MPHSRLQFVFIAKSILNPLRPYLGLHHVSVTLIHGQLCVDQQVILLFLRFFFLWQNYPQQEDAYGRKHARLTVCIVVFMQTYYEWHHEAEDLKKGLQMTILEIISSLNADAYPQV